MKITRESPGTLTVRRVSADGIEVDGETLSGTVALAGGRVLDTPPKRSLDQLTLADFDALLAYAPKVVLLGTGSRHNVPPRELMFAFARNGIGLETMDTAAAARTFNVLAGEDREVAALLYPAEADAI